jgi:hypothetical protein
MAPEQGRNLMPELSVVASGDYNPLSISKPIPLGYNCSCYDEVHGFGASAKIIEDLMEEAKRNPSTRAPRLLLIPWISEATTLRGSVVYRRARSAVE